MRAPVTFAVVLSALGAVGCGLLLDPEPPFDPFAKSDAGRIDTGVESPDARVPPTDAVVSADGPSSDAQRPPIDSGICPDPCGLLPQCGCRAGLQCSIDAAGRVGCYPVGTGSVGDVCDGPADCMDGLLCGILAPSTRGVCVPPCTDSSDCAGPTSACIPIVGAPTTVGACTVSCTLIGDGDPACGGLVCALQDVGGQWATTCVDLGTGMAGDPCTSVASCASELVCLSGVCTRLCSVGAASACLPSETCIALTPTFTIGGTVFGHCVPIA